MTNTNPTISRENVITAYDNTNDAGRKLLENLFGKEVFTKDVKERVKTFEDACNVLGVRCCGLNDVLRELGIKI